MEIDTTNGFSNLGNTCFMNSALQMLIHCRDLTRLLSVYESKDKIVRMYQNLLLIYGNQNGKVLNPISIRQALGVTHKKYIMGSQEDSHEFIIHLLDELEEAIKKEDERISNLISKLFDCNIETVISSVECNQRSTKTEPVRFLSVPVAEGSYVTLNDCFEKFVEPEYMSDEWEAPDGNRYKANKITNIIKFPRNLIFQLKRYRYMRGGKKIDQDVDIPLKWTAPTGEVFDLRGFVLQSGGFSFGHYTYYGKVEDNWYMFNDSTVRQIDIMNIMTVAKSAYLICYRKRNQTKTNQ